MNLRRYRWIVFDAVGTLIHPEPSVAEAYHTVARRYGSRLSVDEIGRRFGGVFRDTEREDGHVTSEAIERDRWRKLVTSVLDDVSDPEACFEDLFAHFASVSAWRCFPEVGPTLMQLKESGFRLAIASNFDSRLNALCEGLPELEPLDWRIISSEVGWRKPSREFYAELLRTLKTPANELLMVGDDYENDVVAAERVGLGARLVCRKREAPVGAMVSLSELVST